MLTGCSPRSVVVEFHAPPKSGSSFLGGSLLPAFAHEARACHAQLSLHRCGTDVRHRCDVGSRFGRVVKGHSWVIPRACCNTVRPIETHGDMLDVPAASSNNQRSDSLASAAARAECTMRSVGQHLNEQPWAWLRQATWNVTSYGTSTLLGPLRLVEGATLHNHWSPPPTLATRVVVLHARHPIESIVSHYYCVSDASVCPKRWAATANRTQPHHPIAPPDGRGLRNFIRRELAGGEGTSLHGLLRRMERLAEMLQRARALEAQGCAVLTELKPPSELAPTQDLQLLSSPEALPPTATCRLRLIVSRYELMTTSFTSWLAQLLAALPDGIASSRSRRALHKTLSAKFERAFLPNGKHKHRLIPGSNLALLDRPTVEYLRSNENLSSLVARLGYPDTWHVWGGGSLLSRPRTVRQHTSWDRVSCDAREQAL